MSSDNRKVETPEQRRQAEAEILRRATERPMGIQSDSHPAQWRRPPSVRRRHRRLLGELPLMARLHSHGSGTIGIYGATCLNLVKEPEFCVEQFDTVARCDIKYTKLPAGSTVNVFVFTGEISEDQAMRIAAILKE